MPHTQWEFLRLKLLRIAWNRKIREIFHPQKISTIQYSHTLYGFFLVNCDKGEERKNINKIKMVSHLKRLLILDNY